MAVNCVVTLTRCLAKVKRPSNMKMFGSDKLVHCNVFCFFFSGGVAAKARREKKIPVANDVLERF